MASMILSRVLQKRYLIMSSTSHCFNIIPIHNVWYSTKKPIKIDSDKTDEIIQAGTIRAIKENLKSAGQLGVIISGIGITVFIVYTLLSELFSSESLDAIYSKARVRCMEHPKIIDLLGAPIKAYGDQTNRGRRRHISHVRYIKNNIEYLKLKFYLEGTRRSGTAFVEMKKNESNKYEYSYIHVMVNNIGIITIEPEEDV